MTRAVLLVLGLVFMAPSLRAQTDPQLAAALRLAQEGQGDSARALARRVLAATAATDAKYPEALYTLALVADTPDNRRLNLQRVAIEYASSPWADDALLQLAQLEYATRNLAGTVQQVQRLLNDYPTSPLRAVAALWGTRAALDQRDHALACQWSTAGIAAAADDIETRNQLEFQRERCLALAAAESTAAARSPAPPPPPATGWTVQVAAFRSEQDTEGTVERVRRLELSVGVIREGAWFKVRSGPFPTREEAQRALIRIRGELGGQPFLVPPPRR